MKYELLDHGYVELVDYMGTDLSPLEAARMSTNNPTGVDTEKDDRLRARLWKDQHHSPFELNYLVIEMMIPMFCLRQIDRHRTLSIDHQVVEVAGGMVEMFTPMTNESYDSFRQYSSRNEFSGRYSVMPDLFYLPPPERFRRGSSINKQSSGAPLPKDLQNTLSEVVQETTTLISSAYRTLLESGAASELARIILPQNQYTRIRIGASMLNWFKFLDLRLREDVQEETRAYAQAIADIIKDKWPKAFDVFKAYTLERATLNAKEKQVLLHSVASMLDEGQDIGEMPEMTRKETEDLIRKLRKTPDLDVLGKAVTKRPAT